MELCQTYNKQSVDMVPQRFHLFILLMEIDHSCNACVLALVLSEKYWESLFLHIAHPYTKILILAQRIVYMEYPAL